MTLNRNSWHYRVWCSSYNERYDVPRSTNLCSYCQRVFWMSLIWLFFACMAGIAVGMALYGIFYLGFWQHTKIAFITLGVIIASVVLIFGLWWFWYEHLPYSEPGLVRQWVRAKKARICPLVEFESK